MDIKIYQINFGRDARSVCMMGYEDTLARQPAGVDSSIYDLVFSGDVPCNNLEDIYRMFNIDHPERYTGRSMSVSDVVEICNGSGDGSAFHFCDSIGFREIGFDPELTQDASKPRTIKVVLVEPGKLARAAEIDASLAGLQKVVGGSIEGFYPFEEQVCIVCNEEGKLDGLPLNRAVYSEPEEVELSYRELCAKFRQAEQQHRHMTGYIVFTEDSWPEPYPLESRTFAVSSDNKAFKSGMGGYSIYGGSIDGTAPCVRLEGYMADEKGGKDGWKIERCYIKERQMLDIIAGTFFICDCSGENFGSLSEEQLKRFTEQFKLPETFFQTSKGIVAVPYKPTKNQER